MSPRPAHAGGREFRRQLGLTTDRPVIMSGHQAELWHAGIAAKALAAPTPPRHDSAAAAWVIVDQDPGAPARSAIRSSAKVPRDRTPARAAIELIAPADPAVVTGRQPPGRTRPIAIHPDTPPAIAGHRPHRRGTRHPPRRPLAGRADHPRALDLLAPARAMGTPDLTPPPPTPLPTIIPGSAWRTELFARLVGAHARSARVRRTPTPRSHTTPGAPPPAP